MELKGTVRSPLIDVVLMNNPALLSEMWDKSLCCADRPQHVGVDHAENLVVRKPLNQTRET